MYLYHKYTSICLYRVGAPPSNPELIFRSLTYYCKVRQHWSLCSHFWKSGQRPLPRGFIQLPFQILSAKNTTFTVFEAKQSFQWRLLKGKGIYSFRYTKDLGLCQNQHSIHCKVSRRALRTCLLDADSLRNEQMDNWFSCDRKVRSTCPHPLPSSNGAKQKSFEKKIVSLITMSPFYSFQIANYMWINAFYFTGQQGSRQKQVLAQNVLANSSPITIYFSSNINSSQF